MLDAPLFDLPIDSERISTVHLRDFRGPVQTHSHDNFQLIVPLGGASMRFVLGNGEPVEVTESQWIVFWPGVIHGLAPSSGVLEFMAVQMVPEAMGAAWGLLGHPMDPPPSGAAVHSADVLLRELVYELIALQADDRPETAALHRVTYGHLCTLAARLIARGDTGPAWMGILGRGAFDSEYVERAVALMREHMAESLSASELARRSATSARNLSRHFKRELGVSPAQYLTLLRIAEASRRLAETRASITEIAYDVGYGSLSHFIHQFRDLQGCSPGAWRRMNRRDRP